MNERNGFLFCADPLRAARPDPQFAGEVAAARAAGGRIALLDHDALLAGDAAGAVARVARDSGPYWYRGWMVPSARYAELEAALGARGCALLTDAAGYRRAHELPGWYQEFAALTPRSVWHPMTPDTPPAADALTRIAAPLGPGPGIVKDYVKSRKHEWHEACYVPELTDRRQLASVVGRFVELQGTFLAGGLVVRSFEPFVAGGEARVWWVDGEAVLTTAHPDTPDRVPAPELSSVREAVARLGLRWVTTDLALREDGAWRVVEVGDGQVSGVPAGADTGDLFAALAAAEARRDPSGAR
ncbi:MULTISPECIES: ATP-grasp domain-containing protein [unclassified Streptomyces]|uniref:ATP-grasp domain-containing protein n=1 Tax=Streptomyces TaxID=1883 RepID=UPI0019029DEC|nr:MULTISPECIES: ATP-grasp domain-containing protein [unclassified Streptomyces]MBK0372032.1 ATP-grasp domain-containing protein [Streptomyces sp. RB110-1]MBK0385251.1 ATP-grasp domain-containing protein [Streptomyces sp. RB110-2]